MMLHCQNVRLQAYSYLFGEFLEQTNDYDPPNSEPGNFDICYPTPSLNYYAFRKKTVSCSTTQVSVPSTSSTVSTAPSESATASTASDYQNLSNLDFLDDTFEEVDNVTSNEIEEILRLAENSNQTNKQIPISQSSTFYGRFIESDENRRQAFPQQNENKNTHRKMMTTIKTLRNCLVNIKSEHREPQNIPLFNLTNTYKNVSLA